MQHRDDDLLDLGGLRLRSRLLVGTGRYATFDELRAVLLASEAQLVTVAVRRVDLRTSAGDVVGIVRELGLHLLPNTSGCHSAADAIRIAQLAREAGLGQLVKLEVIGDPRTLYPDNEATLAAARALVADGFVVLPYCGDDPVLARKLEDAGCAAVMPLAAPIGSGQGVVNPARLKHIVDAVAIPVVVDAGIGTASDAARALELGCAAVLLNTAIAEARVPVQMAHALRLAVRAGRAAYLAGRMPSREAAVASSPLAGVLDAYEAASAGEARGL